MSLQGCCVTVFPKLHVLSQAETQEIQEDHKTYKPQETNRHYKLHKLQTFLQKEAGLSGSGHSREMPSVSQHHKLGELS